MNLSVVVPVYRAENTIIELCDRLSNTVNKLCCTYEIILVDDYSPDKSWEMIKRLSQTKEVIKGVKLSRNFGQHYAITAGLDHAKGEWVVVMDCDLQDQPEEIIPLYNKALEGFDIVRARRQARKDTFKKRLSSKAFYFILNYLTGGKHDPAVANFGIYHRKVIDVICSMREDIRYLPTMVTWVGFKSCGLNVEHAKRDDGGSTYTLGKLLRLSLDIILANSEKPMKLTVKVGLIISFLSILFVGITIVRYFMGAIQVQGYLSLILSVWFFSGLIITTLGVMGLYIGKIFQGVKSRPIYITEKIVGND